MAHPEIINYILVAIMLRQVSWAATLYATAWLH